QIRAAHHRHLRPSDHRAAAHALAHPLRQPPARGSGRSARRQRARHSRQRCLRHHLRGGVGAGRPRRPARRRNPRPRSDLPAEVHDLLPDRGDGRRHLEHHRSVSRLAAPRHRRRGRQVLRAEVRRLHHLHHHDRGADLAAAGPVRPRDGALRTRMAQPLTNEIARYLAERVRWHPLEIAFWLAALASIFLLPNKHLILPEIAILALFALSLDLILGYSGIISLGHAAYFGFGGYVAGLLAKHGIITEPVLALIVSGLVAAVLGFVTSFL